MDSDPIKRAFFQFLSFPSSCNRWLGLDGGADFKESLESPIKTGVLLSMPKLGPSINPAGCCITSVETDSPQDVECTPVEAKLTSKKINCIVMLQRFERPLQKSSGENPD